MVGELRLDEEAWCEIRVAGRLDPAWQDAFEGFTVSLAQDCDGHDVTSITGVTADQAALRGTLERLYTLRLPLLAISCRPIRDKGEPKDD